jgi:hypothetical protein
MIVDDDIFDASIHPAVAMGCCIMIEAHEIVYVGTLSRAPAATGKMVLMNATDFKRLNEHLKRVQH